MPSAPHHPPSPANGHRALHRLDHWISDRQPWQLLALALSLIAGIGAIDLATGFEMSSSIFYLVPVALIAWYQGWWPGLAICLVSAGVWCLVDFSSGHQYSQSWILAWNAAVRMGFFAIVTWLLVTLNAALSVQQALAKIDGLTGLYNGRSFRQQAEAQLQRALNAGSVIALAYLDLDGFKAVNDQHGHEAGDQLLRLLGQHLVRKQSESLLIARLGGDEFAFLLNSDTTASARAEFEQLHHALAELVAERGWGVGCSMGVAIQQGPPTSIQQLLQSADEQMYAVKREGKGKLRVKLEPRAVASLSQA